MRILLCHNYYQQRGGEDESYAAEAWLLKSRGNLVEQYTVHNDAIERMTRWEAARRAFWNERVYSDVRLAIQRQRPDVLHCTNTFPLMSPAVTHAARDEGVPVVQSLRNYRLHCLNSFFLRDGKVCEACLGKQFAWKGVMRGCYRGSRTASAVVAGMLAAHRYWKTWQETVDLFFTPSEFARQKYIEGGMAADKIAVKPNFVHPDPGAGRGGGGYALFVGRLSEEKGLTTLLEAWRDDLPLDLKIIGDGPLADQVQQAAAEHERIEWLGRRPLQEVLDVLGDAACLVMPSVWYETFGRTVIEAFAKGTPAIVSRLGAMSELVVEGANGLLFEAGNAADLADKVRQLTAGPAGRWREAARSSFERYYGAERNYELLMTLYRRAMGEPTAPSGAEADHLPLASVRY